MLLSPFKAASNFAVFALDLIVQWNITPKKKNSVDSLVKVQHVTKILQYLARLHYLVQSVKKDT